MDNSIRSRTCAIEHQILSPRAAFTDQGRGRPRFEDEDPTRTAFQRDRDRIIHSSAFRRLKHKTQVFLSPEGDHYRTRLTHTLEVSQIARTIARGLMLNEDLTEAVALGHDLGHTPFGHAGERALDSVRDGGFRHFEQSLRVVDFLENDGRGMNLTFEVREGIERHTMGEFSRTLEGRAVRLSDRIAYINHDIDDACRAGVLREEELPADICEVLGKSKSARINTLVNSVIENSGETVAMDGDIAGAFDRLHEFMFAHVYTNPVCKGEEGKAIEMIRWLYFFFLDHPDRLPERYVEISRGEGIDRAACDYIAGMTDRYTVKIFEELFVPRSWTLDCRL